MNRANPILPPGPIEAPKGKRTGGTPEGVVVKGCLALLDAHGIMAWRNNTGSQMIPASGTHARRFIRYGAVGAPDIFAILSGGRLLGIECKAKGGKPTDDQLAFGERMNKSGAEWEVIRDVGELANYLAARGYA